MRKIVGRDAILACPDFSEEFTINTYVSKTQIGVVISQNCKPVSFY